VAWADAWGRADSDAGVTWADPAAVHSGDGGFACAVSGDEARSRCAEFGGEVVRRRRGRPRKAGRRKRSGDLVVRPDKPAAIAATMPHRRALGEKAVDQLAESELGRLALRGEAGAGDRRGGLCAALAGVHREPLCSQSPCSRAGANSG